MRYLFVIALWIPFILLVDLFPFMRFGMFAEPIKSAQQTEVFTISIQNNTIEREPTVEELGISSQDFNYLARNYYYKKKAMVLLQNIAKSSKFQAKSVLKIKKVKVKYHENIKDTITIASLIIP